MNNRSTNYKVDESSSDGSANEEVFKNFDSENTDRYLLVYDTYKKWQKDHIYLLSSSHKNNLFILIL